MKMPSWAPRPEAATRAAGVARPRAQGQAMIKTARAALKAWPAGLPATSQPVRVRAAQARTHGTNTAQVRKVPIGTFLLYRTALSNFGCGRICLLSASYETRAVIPTAARSLDPPLSPAARADNRPAPPLRWPAPRLM